MKDNATMKLYDWQRPIVDKLAKSLTNNRYAINASGTGSGKTIMALSVASELNNAGLVDNTLVVAPKVSLSQWRRLADDLRVSTLLLDCINPERISHPRGCKWYIHGGGWKLPPKTLVIWDEPHRNASGVDSKATYAMACLRGLPTCRLLALSATLADSPLKLRALGFWAGMHGFTKPSFYAWCRDNGCRFEQFSGRYVLRFTSSPEKAKFHMANIRRAFGESYAAIDVKDIPDFPDQTIDVITVDLSDNDRRLIVEAYKEMDARLKTRAKSDMAEIGRCRERIEFCKAEAIAELAVGHLESGKSVVIFCNFTSARERIEKKLKSLGAGNIGMIYGGQKEEERQKFIDEFQANRLHVMIVMTAAGGAALSLHDERHERQRVSLITPSFNAAEVKQALGRIRRCQGSSVEQYFILAAGTIEDGVSRKLSNKLLCIDTLNDNDLDALT